MVVRPGRRFAQVELDRSEVVGGIVDLVEVGCRSMMVDLEDYLRRTGQIVHQLVRAGNHRAGVGRSYPLWRGGRSSGRNLAEADIEQVAGLRSFDMVVVGRIGLGEVGSLAEEDNPDHSPVVDSLGCCDLADHIDHREQT